MVLLGEQVCVIGCMWEEVVWNRLRFRHTGLNVKQKVIGRHYTWLFEGCFAEETEEHVLLHCHLM